MYFCALTAQMICAFEFAYKKGSFSHDVDHFDLIEEGTHLNNDDIFLMSKQGHVT